LPKPNYRFQKNQRDAAKRKKKEQKMQRKAEKRAAAQLETPAPVQDAETPQ
jgi:hypothetical protein